MRLTAETSALKARYGRLGWHPPDPVGVSRTSIAKARARLAEYDALANLWWSPNHGHKTGLPGRWRVVHWSSTAAAWVTVFYWEGPRGEFRDVLPIEPLLAKLRRAEDNHRSDVIRKMDEANATREFKRKLAFRRMLAEHDKDTHARLSGGKIVSAPGYVRPRNFGASVGGMWALALVRPELRAHLSNFDKLMVDEMLKQGYE